MAKHLGQLLASIRERAALSQVQASAASGLSLGSVQRAEAAAGRVLKLSSMVKLIETLAKRAVVTPAECAEISALSGDPQLATIISGITASPSVERASSMLDAFTRMSPDEATAHQWLEELMERTSPGVVVNLLQSMSALAGIDLSPAFREVPKRVPDASAKVRPATR